MVKAGRCRSSTSQNRLRKRAASLFTDETDRPLTEAVPTRRERAASSLSYNQVMGKWNDTDEPIAYLITFRTYGTWLAGDERGSVDKYHNVRGTPYAVSSEARKNIQADRLKSPPFLLNAKCRKLVEEAIREVCAHRGWSLIALHVRTNHAHVVSSGVATPGKMLNDFKSYSTRKLRENGEWNYDHSPWVDKGSKRNLWNEDHIGFARNYVLNGQGGPLPEFD